MKDFKLGAQVPEGLIKAGQKLGFKYGGTVKGGDTSGEFKMKTGPMADMDHANMNRKDPQRNASSQRDVESGGRGPLRPKFAEGGEAKKNPYKKGTARYRLWMRKHEDKSFTFTVDGKERTVKAPSKDEAKRKLRKTLGAQYTEKEAGRQSKSTKYMEEHGIKKGGHMKEGYMEGGHASTANKKMPKNVKMKGGLAHASNYMEGGHAKSKANQVMPKNVKKYGGKMKHGGPYKSEPMFGKK